MKKLTVLLFIICSSYSCLCSYAATAKEWMVHTDTQQRVSLSNVECLIGTDKSETFSVLLKDNTLIPDVKEVTFKHETTAGIDNVISTQEPFFAAGASTLIISNLTAPLSDINIYNLTGQRVVSVKAESGKTEIDIANLAPGAYIVAVGNSSFKFLKK